MVRKPRHQICEEKLAINFGKSLCCKAKIPFPSCTFYCEPFFPWIQRFCSVMAIAQVLVGQWGGVVGILWSCFLPSAELQLSLLPLKLGEGKQVLVVPVYIDWLYAEKLVFCVGPQNINCYSRSPVNPLWNKTYCAWTCPFKAPINKLVTAYVFLFTAAEWCSTDPIQEHNGNKQQGFMHCSLPFDPRSLQKGFTRELASLFSFIFNV